MRLSVNPIANAADIFCSRTVRATEDVAGGLNVRATVRACAADTGWRKDWTQIERRFGVRLADSVKPLEPRYNIAPTDEVVAIRRRGDEQPEARLLRWGLIPHWSKDTKSAATMINAKAETLLERPAFRALVETHRCLIPAEGFYEWRTNEGPGSANRST